MRDDDLQTVQSALGCTEVEPTRRRKDSTVQMIRDEKLDSISQRIPEKNVQIQLLVLHRYVQEKVKLQSADHPSSLTLSC